MLVACGNNPNSKSLEDEVKPVKADTSDMLLGYDLDEDGIREDIEEYIKNLNITDTQKAATRFEAKILQDTLTVDTKDLASLKKSNQNMLAAINCMNSQFENYEDADAIGVSLEEKTFNTTLRLNTYKQYNAALAESELAIELPSGDSCQVF